MYLAGFREEEKNAFFTLAKSIIDADNKITESEEILLNQFLSEMAIKIDQVKQLSFNEAVDVFKGAGSETKKQVYVELFALTMCDADFAEEEQNLLLDIANKLDIPEETQVEIRNCVVDLLSIYERMNKLVEE